MFISDLLFFHFAHIPKRALNSLLMGLMVSVDAKWKVQPLVSKYLQNIFSHDSAHSVKATTMTGQLIVGALGGT